MKSLTLVAPFVFLAISSLVGAAPALVPISPTLSDVKKRDDPTPTQILQYALTLEHLEDTFYSGALAKYDEAAFEAAGFPSWVRGRFTQIGQHEAAHVAFLTSALGKDAVAACEYSFPYTDLHSFVALSQVLEGVGTSAYLGAAKFLPDPTVLTAAGAILTTEARHNAWLSSAVLKGSPWSGALDTPLDQNQVFSLASAFIKSCPSSNPALPFTAFPTLMVEGAPTSGQKVTLTFKDTDTAGGTRHLALFSGLTTMFADIDTNNQATLPEGLQGVVYAVVSSDGSTVTDASTIAGPAILSFPFFSSASN